MESAAFRFKCTSAAPAVLQKKHRSNTSKSLDPTNSSIESTTLPGHDLRVKRRALESLVPSAHFGLPPASVRAPVGLPPHVITVLRRFAPSQFEEWFLPFTHEVAATLEKSFPHEAFSYRSHFVDVSNDDDYPRANALLNLAVRVHLACVRNSAKALDVAAWYPCVKTLLSVNPPSSRTSQIPDLPLPEPYVPSADELFVTVDATTKTTRKTVLPQYPNVKLNYLLTFNPEHASCASSTAVLHAHSLFGNAFNDASLQETIVVLGVEVKTPGSTGGELSAEYQICVWAAKTLQLARAMAAKHVPLTAACDLALGLTVCGHVWSLHVTYWLTPTAHITHGPVVVGSTDTLYGTLKIIRFVVEFKDWARDIAIGDWAARISTAAPVKDS